VDFARFCIEIPQNSIVFGLNSAQNASKNGRFEQMAKVQVISQVENTSGEMTMLRTLTISESVFNQLAHAAKQNRLSPQALAERLLVERLSAEEQAWRTQFESLLARVHERMTGFDPIQIEADITAASSEVKAKRRAHRRAR
jgi:hypothetical protein